MPLKKLLSPPVFHDDEEKTRKAYFLYIILLTCIVIFVLLLTVRSLMPSNIRILPVIILLALIFLFLFLFVLVHRGYVQTASLIFVIAGWTGMTIEAFFADGIRDITVIANIIIILMATLLLGQRTAIVFTLLTIVSIWTLVFLEENNIIHPSLDKVFNLARDLTTVFILVALLIFLYSRNQQIALERIKKELLERNQAENIIRESEKRLKEQNEEYAVLNEKLKIAVRKAKESDRLKTAFLQNMSHEIRSPMNAIVGFSELLKRQDISNVEIDHYTDIIIRSSKQLLSVVTDILTISSIETGQEQVHETLVNVNFLLHELEMVFNHRIKNKNLTLNILPALRDEQALTVTDETKLTQILTNLINNAVKFTNTGTIEVGYTLDKKMIWFYVKDTGIGIDSRLHKKIFERFKQANNSINRKYGGTGLGLAISKGQTEMLGGKITVRSKPGEGSVFSFSIPYKPDLNMTAIRNDS